MQQPVRPIPCNRRARSRLAIFGAAVGAAALLLSGCLAPTAGPSGQPEKPLHGQSLTLSCPDAAMADAITPMVRAWEARTGATVTIRREPMTDTDSTDVAIIPAGELGVWADPGQLAAVPAKLRGDPAFQWNGLLPAYGERLVEWGGQAYAVPLTGDGHVLVYRADRFAEKSAADALQAKWGRAAGAPATWEEFAAAAEVFTQLDKKPSLPPVPTDPGKLFDLLSRVASSADRPALSDFQLAAKADANRDALAFQFAVTTGKPRLQTSGFLPAAKWLERIRLAKAVPLEPEPNDPVAALADGRAVMALLSLDQLARLPRENGVVPPRFALAGVPGTREIFGAPERLPPDVPANYVPHFGGGRLGVVRSRCPNPEAAFDLLADLGGPARGAELIATPGLGAGPTRVIHVDRERLLLWYGYGFDEERTKALQDTMRHYVEPAVKNPTFGLRGPDRAMLIAEADSAVRLIGVAPPPGLHQIHMVWAQERLNSVEGSWNARDAKVPADTLLRWRQRAAGLN